jgi:hypothetical protein
LLIAAIRSGGYGGFSAEVNASAGSDTSLANKEGKATKQSTMIATYKASHIHLHAVLL